MGGRRRLICDCVLEQDGLEGRDIGRKRKVRDFGFGKGFDSEQVVRGVELGDVGCGE
jgi:hypothetical protein